jgi:uncharacterized protein YbjT (DUF2867 family)
VTSRVADFGDAAALATALGDARLVAMCGNAVHLPAVVAAVPATAERLVAMGSTRRFSRVPDPTGRAVAAAEALLGALAVPSVLIMATMIYGTGRGVVEGFARSVVAIVPAGVRVQPIHVDDLAASVAAALVRPAAPGRPIIVAGPRPLAYRDMVGAVARARGRPHLIIPVPRGILELAGRLFGGNRLGAMLRRLAEDKSFDITEMRRRLDVVPRPFDPAA